MKRLALALLLTGTACAGGGAAPPVDAALRPLLGLSGRAFDLKWVDAALGQQTTLGGLSAWQSRDGQSGPLRTWAAKDRESRRSAVQRLLALKQHLQPQGSVAVPVFIANVSGPDFVARPDAFFLAEYGRTSARVSALAHLALSRSQHPALRREAAALLRYEAKQRNERKEFR